MKKIGLFSSLIIGIILVGTTVEGEDNFKKFPKIAEKKEIVEIGDEIERIVLKGILDTLSLEALTRLSDCIIIGEIKEVKCDEELEEVPVPLNDKIIIDSMFSIYTYVTIQVKEYLKLLPEIYEMYKNEDEIKIRISGGEISDDKGYRIRTPLGYRKDYFIKGDTLLLFLTKWNFYWNKWEWKSENYFGILFEWFGVGMYKIKNSIAYKYRWDKKEGDITLMKTRIKNLLK